MIELLIAKLGPYLLAGLAILAGWFAARQSGKAAGRAEVQRKQEKAASESRRKINEADTKLAEMADSDIRDELRRWVRDDS
ncbi:MAG TPA: hypothetical protein VNQ97_03565 [Burkholderiaceae bacterium]|nr:hypothetical protein [Burkholderiaceae bacterium]